MSVFSLIKLVLFQEFMCSVSSAPSTAPWPCASFTSSSTSTRPSSLTLSWTTHRR